MERAVRTYKLRRGRVSTAQQNALDIHGSHYLLAADGEGTINLASALNLPHFIMEVGFGMGEATWKMAAAHPDTAILALDLHTPGIGKLISHLVAENLDNVRIVEGDAIEVLQHRIAPDSLDAVRLFFPDPWPKKRHFKRRFIVPENLALVASRIKVGGALHIATDWVEYADHARENLEAASEWKIVESHPLCIPSERPRTKFEQRGIDAGRVITDIVAIRVS